MHTKHQIQQLLASAGVFPNKHFGQHFLIDLNLMRLMIESARIGSDDVVLEVGCGTGSLTEDLAEQAGYCIAVEVDDTLAKIAQEQLAQEENVNVINTDILESKHTISGTVTEAIEQARKTHGGRLMLVANLPYNVACPVMLNLVTGPMVVDEMYVTVQKQVAERMTAKPGSGDYGTLSIFLSATGQVKAERVLKPTVFWPQPQVESAMVSYVRNQEKVSHIKSMELFGEVINLFMGHRRKMLKGCTKFGGGELAKIDNWPEIFKQCSIDPTQRPEKLPPL
ncbi:MAG: 16S rRNA (adenine(1518)-N(6)/adenine(1519)-N(6))-dimethyltransferase RsmA [Planctomycetota bacterium]|jgi:16S rRNA (adenine1518-N6/adenine1519-N6)-dimethyltransferase